MNIQVFGMGCAPCKQMLQNVNAAVRELGLACSVEQVTRLQAMLEAGVTGTPALVVNGEVKCVGKVLDVTTIRAILESSWSEVRP